MKLWQRVIFVIFTAIFLAAFAPGWASAAEDDFDEGPSLVDDKLLEEFMGLIKKFHTNSTCIGTTLMEINGAETKSKYVSYMLDLGTRRIDSESSGEKCTLVLTPGEMWYYFPQNRVIVNFKSRRILAKMNSLGSIAANKKNYRLQKKEKDGEFIFVLTDFANNYKFTYYFDASTKLLTRCVVLDNNNGKETETTYAGWEQKKIDRDKFEKPSGCVERNGDNY